MLIIFEGPDCSGKTTLVNILKQYLDANGRRHVTLHARPPTKSSWDEYVTPLEEYKPNSGIDILCDRWHWGERIYPEVLSRTSDMTLSVFRDIETFLNFKGAVVVRPYVSISTLCERMNARGDDLITVEQLPKIAHGFNFIASVSKIPVVTFNPALQEGMGWITSLIRLGHEREVEAQKMEAETPWQH